MEKYNPDKNVNAEDWLQIDELERLELVEDYHRDNDEQIADDALKMHCSMHVTVESQIAENEVPVVRQALAKLTRQGLGRHEAIHAISAVLAEELFNAMNGPATEFSISKYRRRLEKITAKRWRKSLY